MTDKPILSFDLVTDPWLPVSLTDGTTETWGLREFFARAHDAQGLNEPSPLAYTATMRMLIAILHRAFNGPRTDFEWESRMGAGAFDADEIGAYLDRWRHRFDLYHPERPFAQVDAGEVMAEGTRSPITRLIMERTSGNNPTLFDHSWDENPILLSPGDAVRALLTAHQYAFAGSGGAFMQAPMVAGYSVMLEGANLFQTLMLNLQRYDETKPDTLPAAGDGPWWEFEIDPPVTRQGLAPRGLTDLLTWRGRKLRLLPEPDGRVAWVNYAQRYFVADPELRLRDPFKRYVMAKSGTSKGSSFPKNFSPGKALWRDAATLIEKASSVDDDPEGRPAIISWLADVSEFLRDNAYPEPSIVVTGLVNNQARIDLWRMDRLPLPVAILQDDERIGSVRRAITIAEGIRGALRDAGTRFASVALTKGERSPDPNDITRERTGLNLDGRYWSQLESRFQSFMTELSQTEEPESPYQDWALDLYDIARNVYREATQAAGGDSRWLKAQAEGARLFEVHIRKYVSDVHTFRQARLDRAVPTAS